MSGSGDYTSYIPSEELEKESLKQDLIQIYNSFERILSGIGQVYIAGGAIRDMHLGKQPKDYDIFLLVDKERSFKEVSVAIQDALAPSGLSIYSSVRKAIDLVTNPGKIEIKQDYGGTVHDVKYITSTQRTVKIQIIISNEESVYSLLENFDWNICLFAYGYLPHTDRVGFYNLTDINDLGYNKPLVINCLSHPYRAMKRGYAFSQRYSMEFPATTIKMICKKIAESDSQGEVDEKGLFKDFVKSQLDNG